MKEIRGDAKNIRALMGGSKYHIDYYQREFKWGTKHITELLDDLADKFLLSYDKKHDRTQVEQYGHYFLGSIIISDKDGKKFIIDGQQRLTSLTLLLIYLLRSIEDTEQRGQLSELIFSQKYGKKSFNLDVPDRTACMDALYNGDTFDENSQPESICNILARYRDIEENFPNDLTGSALPFFADWLIENVHMVEITAYSDEDAYTIFETMNDRGLSLTATDMLKGYLLANIKDPSVRNRASNVWKGHVAQLIELGKEEDADAIKAWLRGQYAESIRERKRGAKPQDFDLIGTEFHRWVRDNDKTLGLKTGSNFASFIERNFAFYAGQYLRIREAAETLTEGLEYIHFNDQNKFTLQYAVLLAALNMNDAEKDILRKLRVISSFIDILITRRIWNSRAIDYSTMQYAMFLVMKEIRGKPVSEIVKILTRRLKAESEKFSSNDRFSLHGANGRQIHLMLARLTTYLETSSGLPSRFPEYIKRSGKNGYEIEHIWADHPDRHEDEFDHPNDFREYRNRFGDLLLLPKTFNASYGDLPYKKKREHYLKQNLLAQSLHEKAYERSPGFKRFIKATKLEFQPHKSFKKADLDARHLLYRELVELVWNPERLIEEAKA